MQVLEPFEGPFWALGPSSGAPLPEAFRLALRDPPEQPHQVVSRAIEYEQPVHFGQPAQLHLPQRPGLLEPSERLLHQPAPAQSEAVTRAIFQDNVLGDGGTELGHAVG